MYLSSVIYHLSSIIYLIDSGGARLRATLSDELSATLSESLSRKITLLVPLFNPEKSYIREYTSGKLRKICIVYRQLWIPVLFLSRSWQFGVNVAFVYCKVSYYIQQTNQPGIYFLYDYKFSGSIMTTQNDENSRGNVSKTDPFNITEQSSMLWMLTKIVCLFSEYFQYFAFPSSPGLCCHGLWQLGVYMYVMYIKTYIYMNISIFVHLFCKDHLLDGLQLIFAFMEHPVC